MKKILFIGGTFNKENGFPSGLISKIHEELKNYEKTELYLKKDKFNIDFFNGGNINFLHKTILPSVKNYDIVFWFANVSNDEIKERDVKELNPKTILITSKRNDNNKYTFAELITHALSIKANLTIEFSKTKNGFFNMMVFDPLGNSYYNGTDIKEMTTALIERTLKLTGFTRMPSKQAISDKEIIVPDEKEFINFAHECADIFHNLIRPAKNTDRFLGNMSFRCQNGFPSFRGEGNMVYVSRRNVDKSDITSTAFVPTYLEDSAVRYFGEHKPSVDTPIQLKLYSAFPWVKYMLHAHCYVNLPKGMEDCASYTTFNPIPCGAIEEVKEILDVTFFERTTHAFQDYSPRLTAINLIGHGCILMAKDVEIFKELKKHKDNCFVARPTPEPQLNLFKEDIINNYIKDNKDMSFDEYFSTNHISKEKYQELISIAKSVKVEKVYYESFGATEHDSISTYTRKDGTLFRINSMETLLSVYNKMTYYKNRLFIHDEKDFCHIVSILRDTNKMDIHVYIEKF